MRRTLTRLAPLAAALVLAGCAAMSAEECRTANWRDQGYRDALAGRDGRAMRQRCSVWAMSSGLA